MPYLCYKGTHENVIAANAQIDANCGFPDAYTQTWGSIKKAYQQEFWFFAMPTPAGYKNRSGDWTQEQMIDSVVNVEIEESQPSWFVPPRI